MIESIIKKLLKNITDKKNIIIEEEKDDGGYHRSCYKPSKNCSNLDSYGIICVRCGKCGRKFVKAKKIKNNIDILNIILNVLFEI